MINREVMQQALEALDGLYLPGELERVNAAIVALRERLAQPEQEPVAHLWQQSETGRTRVVTPDQGIPADDGWRMVGPLYIVPPQRKPLTEEEIASIDQSVPEHIPLKDGKRLFARAIERAHGIGGGDA